MPDLKRGGPRTRGAFRRVAFLGGIYSNYLALAEALRSPRARGVDAVFALGDFGAFGPHPDRTVEILRERGRARHPGQLRGVAVRGRRRLPLRLHRPARQPLRADLLRLHAARTRPPSTRRWMGDAARPPPRSTLGGAPRAALPRLAAEDQRVPLGEHDAARRSSAGCSRDHDADVVVCTHTGLHWSRFVEPGRGVVNVGALGPARQRRRARTCGSPIVEAADGGVRVEFVPVPYDHERLAREMRDEGLPAGVRGDDPHGLVDHLPGDPARQGAGPGPPLTTRRLVILALALAATALTLLPICNALFDCGCTWPLWGGADHCNIHHPAPPDCPLCAGVAAGNCLCRRCWSAAGWSVRPGAAARATPG